jgi:hypothetical protein
LATFGFAAQLKNSLVAVKVGSDHDMCFMYAPRRLFPPFENDVVVEVVR